MNMDNEDEPLCADLSKQNILLKTCAGNEHVPGIKLCIHTIKDQPQSAFFGTTFKNTPIIMMVALIIASAFWIY